MRLPEFSGEDLAQSIALAKRWVRRARGKFSAYVFSKETGVENVRLRDQLLDELVRQKLIERDEHRNGWYHRVDTDLVPMDWQTAQVEPYPLWLPLGLNEKVIISPGNVIIVAGETNAGKTAFVLNTIYRNLAAFGGAHDRVRLFNSEMHPAELRGRLMAIDQRQDLWSSGLEPYSRTRDFHLVVDPDGLNVIDYMENLDEFWKVGQQIQQIHNALQGGVAIVCLQKKSGADLARGAEFTLEKARLGLSIFFDGHANYMRITKCKTPVSFPNPQGQEIDFTIHAGSNMVPIVDCDWSWVTKDQRAARTRARDSEARLAMLNNGNRGFRG
jgi:hypothetical protein